MIERVALTEKKKKKKPLQAHQTQLMHSMKHLRAYTLVFSFQMYAI